MAAARIAAHPPAPAGPLPPQRRRARSRAHARAGRLPGLAPGPGRQRRSRPVAARRLRRPAPDRSGLRRRRRAARSRDRPATRRDRRPRLPHLARARLRHLGGAQRARPLHPVQDDVLGGARPRCASGRRRAPPERPQIHMAPRRARDPRVHRDALLVGAARQLHPSRRRRGARRQPAAGRPVRLRRPRPRSAGRNGRRAPARARPRSAALPLQRRGRAPRGRGGLPLLLVLARRCARPDRTPRGGDQH